MGHPGSIVMFDLDDTLMSRDEALRRFALLAANLGRGVDDANLVVQLADRNGDRDRREFISIIREQLGIPLSLDRLFAWYEAIYPTCFECSSHTRSLLEQLRARGWKLSVVTNGDADRQVRKLINAGIYDLFDSVCAASEIGSEKPDGRLFAEAARRAGSQLAGWMIGDSFADDIEGGRRVGLRTVWVGGQLAASKGDPPSTIVASTVDDAIRHILTQAQVPSE